MRVLALTRYGRLGASSRLRTYQYVDALRQSGLVFDISPLFDDDYVASLYQRRGRVGSVLWSFARRISKLVSATDFDAIWVEKEVLPWVPSLLDLALLPKRLPLVVDYDDAIFHRYDLHRSPVVRALLGRKIDRVMARADLVVAGNDYLRARAEAAGALRVEVVPTVVDLDRYPMSEPRPAGRPIIGWIGTPSTAHYLEMLTPVLQSLAGAFEFDAVAIGARPDQLSGSAFVAKPWSEATEASDMSAFDIGIMPLADTPWELGKCGYKLIQYMALGRPTVASAVGANKQIVSNGESGFLVDSQSGWLVALERLLGDRNLRVSFGRAGRAIVEQRYELKSQTVRLTNLLLGLAQ
jgi:glycosyltransferase involved in cell wall biosynthesis